MFLSLFLGCNTSDEKLRLTSTSKKYNLVVDVNNETDNKAKKGCLRLKLYNQSHELLNLIQTGASDNTKWQVLWHPTNDTIIVDSKDIGYAAYQITEGKNISPVTWTDELKVVADSAFKTKYDDN